MIVKLLTEHHLEFFKLKRRLQRLVRVYTCQNVKWLEISIVTCTIIIKGEFNFEFRKTNLAEPFQTAQRPERLCIFR